MRNSANVSSTAVLWVTCLVASFLAPAVAHAAQDEVRGTWLTTTANDALTTPAKTAETMRRLREIGLNTVYVECWKNGYTEFPSQTLQKTIGIGHKINLPDLQRLEGSVESKSLPHNAPPRDLLAETIIEAHRNQLLHFAWFEYGFMAASKATTNELRTKKPQWLLRDKAGSEIAPDGMVWMNPLHPEVRTFLLNIILDAAVKYDLDGIQLDDRLAWPANTMGYDEFTRTAYGKEHNGSPPPEDPDDADWVKWRTAKITEFAGQVHDALRKARPDILISVSPSPYPWSAEHHAADWPTWVKNGWMDEFVPQLYRDNYTRFSKDWPEQLDQMGKRQADLIGGLRVVGDGASTPWLDLSKMVDQIRESGGGGHVWWFSRGVLDTYPDEMKEYYDVASRGYAKHPKRPEDWRPAPIVGNKRGDHWTLRVDNTGNYQLIVQKDGAWSELMVKHLNNGVVDIQDHHYTGVELLRDRRGR